MDGRAPPVFLMYQAIDRNSPFLDRQTPEPRLPRGSLVGTMSLAQFATAAPSAPVVAAMCAAEILGPAGFSIVPALLPQFIETWSLTNTQAGWLAGIFSAGYMLAVISLVSLTDRRPAFEAQTLPRCPVARNFPVRTQLACLLCHRGAFSEV